MANSTDPFAQSVHGTNPQYLVEKITRLKIYNCTYWKEECFGLTAKSLIDKAIRLKYCGGNYGGNIKPTKFLCLVLKMLQLQPEREIVMEYIKNENFKYLRALGAFYLRLTGKADEVYHSLEPLLYDFRPIIYRGMSGWSVMHMDEFIDSLLREELVCDITLPHMVKRIKMEELKTLPPRKSNLEKELIEMAEMERLAALRDENDDEENEDENEVEQVQNNIVTAAPSKATTVKMTTIRSAEAMSSAVPNDHSTAVVFKDDDENENEEIVPTTTTKDRDLERSSRQNDGKADKEEQQCSRSKYSDDEDNDRQSRKKDRNRSRSRDDYDDRGSSRRKHRDDSRDRHTSSRRRDDSRDRRKDSRREDSRDRRRDSRSRSPDDRRNKRKDDKYPHGRNERDDRDYDYHRRDRYDDRPQKKKSSDKDVDDEELQAYSSQPKKSLDDKKISNEKRFDRMFGKKDSVPSSSTAANKSNPSNKKPSQGGKEIVNDKGEKFLITAPEGSVEYWNQIRESLGMKKLKS